MDRRPTRKLTLNRQTVRTLTTHEMAHVAGGAFLVPSRVNCDPLTNWNCPKSIPCKPVVKFA
jgi:hypothetical protein